MFVTAKNKVKRTFVEQIEAKYFFLFASKQKIQSEMKRKQAKKLVLDFRLSKQKQKRKIFFCETGPPYLWPIKHNVYAEACKYPVFQTK
jgi:hypothetical protein